MTFENIVKNYSDSFILQNFRYRSDLYNLFTSNNIGRRTSINYATIQSRCDRNTESSRANERPKRADRASRRVCLENDFHVSQPGNFGTGAGLSPRPSSARRDRPGDPARPHHPTSSRGSEMVASPAILF